MSETTLSDTIYGGGWVHIEHVKDFIEKLKEELEVLGVTKEFDGQEKFIIDKLAGKSLI